MNVAETNKLFSELKLNDPNYDSMKYIADLLETEYLRQYIDMYIVYRATKSKIFDSKSLKLLKTASELLLPIVPMVVQIFIKQKLIDAGIDGKRLSFASFEGREQENCKVLVIQEYKAQQDFKYFKKAYDQEVSRFRIVRSLKDLTTRKFFDLSSLGSFENFSDFTLVIKQFCQNLRSLPSLMHLFGEWNRDPNPSLRFHKKKIIYDLFWAPYKRLTNIYAVNLKSKGSRTLFEEHQPLSGTDNIDYITRSPSFYLNPRYNVYDRFLLHPHPSLILDIINSGGSTWPIYLLTACENMGYQFESKTHASKTGGIQEFIDFKTDVNFSELAMCLLMPYVMSDTYEYVCFYDHLVDPDADLRHLLDRFNSLKLMNDQNARDNSSDFLYIVRELDYSTLPTLRSNLNINVKKDLRLVVENFEDRIQIYEKENYAKELTDPSWNTTNSWSLGSRRPWFTLPRNMILDEDLDGYNELLNYLSFALITDIPDLTHHNRALFGLELLNHDILTAIQQHVKDTCCHFATFKYMVSGLLEQTILGSRVEFKVRCNTAVLFSMLSSVHVFRKLAITTFIGPRLENESEASLEMMSKNLKFVRLTPLDDIEFELLCRFLNDYADLDSF